MFKNYWLLAKPGIVVGNLLTAVAGYLFASHLQFVVFRFVFAMLGFALVMAASSVVNNLYDRDVDKVMTRTKSRPTVRGDISLTAGIIFTLVLVASGFSLLAMFTNLTTIILGLAGFIIYAAVYTPLKRKTYHATLVGGFAGAMPIMGGYTAYNGHLDLVAIVLGLIMLMWQMPHFYALAFLHQADYKRARVPAAVLVIGARATVYWMLFYTLMFMLFNSVMYKYLAYPLVYVLSMSGLGLVWLYFSWQGLRLKPLADWSRWSFLMSLVTLVFMSVYIGLF